MSISLARPSIAILGTRGIPAAYGGFETFAEESAVRLVASGVDVTVYCESTGGSQPESYKGVHLQYRPAIPCGPLTTILFDLRCLWDARKSFHVVYLLGYGAAQFSFIPRLFGSKVWLNVDGIEWKRAKWGRLATTYFKMMEFFSTLWPNRVIADAAGIRQHLLERHRWLPPCTVIPYGAPIIDARQGVGLLAEWGLAPGSYYLVVCRLEPENHVREIVEGFAKSDSQHPLIIVGDHQADSQYARALLPLESDKVRFIGTVFDKPTLESLRYHCVAYFHGHSVGGTNPSLLEAMGCGNVVLAHDNIFNQEVLQGSGLFFGSVEDIPALVKDVETMSVESRALLSNQGKERIRNVYNWDRVTLLYLNLLSELD